MRIAIDPGEHIGVTLRLDDNQVLGITFAGEMRLRDLWVFMSTHNPGTVIYEEFALRQGAAQKLVGNKFITCEVIGIIKLYSYLYRAKLIPLQPSCKEFCGFTDKRTDPAFKEIDTMGQQITEHVRDAYRLLRYAELFKCKD